MIMHINAKRQETEWNLICTSDDIDPENEYPHCDVMVITTVINEWTIDRVLVDKGSSIDIITLNIIDKIRLRSQMEPYELKVVIFGREATMPKGRIFLPVLFSEGRHTRTRRVEFVVFKQIHAYNVILGRLSICAIKLYVSKYNLKAKFSAPTGMGYLTSSQKMAQKGYMMGMESETLSVESMPLPEKEANYIPDMASLTTCVHLDEDKQRFLTIRANLPEDLSDRLTIFLKN